MKKWWILILCLVLAGCSGTFQQERSKQVGSLQVIGGYTVLERDIGVLYEYFNSYNAFSESEADTALRSYTGIISAIQKLKRKTTAGKTDYYRLLFFVEDVTEYWEDLRAVLNSQVEAGLDDDLLTRAASALYLNVRDDVDNLLEVANIQLRVAEGEMDAATYAKFRDDAQNIIKAMSPLFQKGIDILL